MHFLPDVWVECDVCHGKRYNPETLAVRYKGKSIADVLEMRVHEALELFANLPKIRRVLQTLADVGLDYLALGQAAPTLSGGEAQRVKLAAELARPSTGRTVYILDEPTTGLHFDDISRLLEVLNRLVDLGNTVIVVEHNLDVIKTADWVIDLGPEAGSAGGRVVVAGTPEDVVRDGADRSHTAAALAPVLTAGPVVERPRYDPHAAAAEAVRPDDVELEAVGQNAAMPWQTDGRRWHTAERVSHEGKPVRWEGKILDWIDEQVHALGSFAETDWSQRTVIEIAAPNRSAGWFLHALTGQEWLLRLVFRVGKNTFKGPELVRRLGIRPLNETPGLEVYGADDRVWVTPHKGPWQSVTVLVHRLEEIDTPAFRDFLAEAARAFHANLKRLQTKPEDVMPWKVNGQRWHLGDKGFAPGKKVRWDRSLLSRLLDLVREIEPALEVRWDNRDHIALYVPGVSRAWGIWRTKESDGLVSRFFGKRGQFNLSRVEALAAEVEIGSEQEGGDVLRLVFTELGPDQARRLRDLLTEHRSGFGETFGY
jgi:excinuclease ABC subunit A